MRNSLILTFLLLILGACTPGNSSFNSNPDSQPAVLEATLAVPDCGIQPIKVPAKPKEIPASTQLDEATGLHVTGIAPEIDFSAYRLAVSGLVEQPLSLQYDELRCLPKVTADPLLVCRGFFEDQASWSGAPIAEILKLAKPLPQATTVALISADGFKKEISLEDALNPENFLAYEWEGQPLPILHGFPLRAVIPAEEGNFWVKWLVEINVY